MCCGRKGVELVDPPVAVDFSGVALEDLAIGFGVGDLTDEAGRGVVDLDWFGTADLAFTGTGCVGGVTVGGEGVEGVSSAGAVERTGSGGADAGFSFSREDMEDDGSDNLLGPASGGARDVAEFPTLFGGHSRRSLISS